MNNFTRTALIMSLLIGLATTDGCAPSSSNEDRSPPADLILIGGQVITLQDTEPEPAPTAVAITGDRIVYVGDDDGARALASDRTRVVVLAGAVVVPGFCDSHAHLYGLGKALDQIDLTGTASADQCVALVAAAAGQASGWLEGRGWDQNDWQEKVYPHRALLDSVVSDRPVLLRRVDGHAGWVNSAALAAAGIDRTTDDPAGGTILRDGDGEPTGILIDNAVDLVREKIPSASDAQIRRRIVLASAHCIEHGITAVHEAGVPWRRLQIYRELAETGDLPLRIYAMLEDDEQTLAQGFAAGIYERADGLLTVRAVKLYADGALGSRGARLLRPYSDDPGNRGLVVTPPDHLREVASAAARHGFQVCTHAIGDGANRLVLDLYAELLAEGKPTDARWRIEHAQILAPEDIPRFAALGVIAAMQPVHCTSDMDWVPARLGPDRLTGAYAWRSLLDSGAHLCFGTDFPIEQVDPLRGLYAARTRTHPDGTPVGGWLAHECVDGRTALRLYTAAGAYAAFLEQELGQVAPGFRADLTLLSADPITCAPADLLRARTLMTIVGGRTVYDGR